MITMLDLTFLPVIGVVALLSTAAVAIRRLYFHPLSKFPGPKLAALTWNYEFFFDFIKGGRYVFKIQELHKKYGPIVRITPDELHVNDVGFLEDIYAPSLTRRDKYIYQQKSLRFPGAVGTTLLHEVHKQRREALAPFFTRKSVLYLEPMVQQKVEQLVLLVGRHAIDRTPLNLSDAVFAFGNDLMNKILFGAETNLMADEKLAHEMRDEESVLLTDLHAKKHFPWFYSFVESLPLPLGRLFMPAALIVESDLIARTRDKLVQIMGGDKLRTAADSPTGKTSLYDGILDNRILADSDKKLPRLEQEAALFFLAGSASPAKALYVIFYHLIANPPVMKKLLEELSTVPHPASWADLEKLPYLTACIEEGNRLSFGVTAREVRIAHEPLYFTSSSHAAAEFQNTSYTIPAHTPISTTSLAAHTAATVFPDPYTFEPARWLGDEGRERRRFQLAFGKGGRKCIAIEFAKCELYLVVAALVREFDMRLWQTTDKDVEFAGDYQVGMTDPKNHSKGVRVTVSRREL